MYGKIPFWRAEVGRLTLFIGDIEFEDYRLSLDEFSRVKEVGKLDDGTLIPFKQIPCLVVDGVSIAQTGGIARFCGKLAGLYPKDDDLNGALIDQFIDLSTDINVMISHTGRIKNEVKKLNTRKDLAYGALYNKIYLLESCISNNSDHLVGARLTIADLAIWRLLGWVSSGILDGIPTTILADFPRVRRVCITVDQLPKVQKWIHKTFPENYNRGTY